MPIIVHAHNSKMSKTKTYAQALIEEPNPVQVKKRYEWNRASFMQNARNLHSFVVKFVSMDCCREMAELLDIIAITPDEKLKLHLSKFNHLRGYMFNKETGFKIITQKSDGKNWIVTDVCQAINGIEKALLVDLVNKAYSKCNFMAVQYNAAPKPVVDSSDAVAPPMAQNVNLIIASQIEAVNSLKITLALLDDKLAQANSQLEVSNATKLYYLNAATKAERENRELKAQLEKSTQVQVVKSAN